MISREEVDSLANLARLELDESQKASLGEDLGNILGYFEQLKEVKIDDLETQDHLVINVLRPDSTIERPEASAQALVEAAPKHNGQYVRVKKIL